jgi:histidinol dehydrogenase
MMQTIDLRDLQPTSAELAKLVPRAQLDVSAATDVARDLIDAVRETGEDALLEQAGRLDGVRPPRIRIHADEIGRAVESLDPAVRSALEAINVDPRATTAVEFRELIARDTARWKAVAAKANIKLD